jgi:hypothetical protein
VQELGLPRREWHQRPGTGALLVQNSVLRGLTLLSRAGAEIGANRMIVSDLIHHQLATRLLIRKDLAIS